MCSEWSVRDIAAHLLDSALRRIAADRDEFVLPPRRGEVADYEALVGFLDRLNAEWVTANRRLSPQLLTDLIEWAEPRLATTLAALDPDSAARYVIPPPRSTSTNRQPGSCSRKGSLPPRPASKRGWTARRDS